MKTLDAVSRDYKLRNSARKVWWLLRDNPGQVSFGYMRKRTGLSIATLIHAVDELKKRGYIVQHTETVDGTNLPINCYEIPEEVEK